MREIAQFFKVLADEARIKILWLLFNNPELCVCDIMETLGITQSKASRHLATLRHAGLVIDRKEAAWSYYRLCPVQSALERAQLETLWSKLANHPSSDRILRDLQKWLKQKSHDESCAPKTSCHKLKTKQFANPILLPLKGDAQ